MVDEVIFFYFIFVCLFCFDQQVVIFYLNVKVVFFQAWSCYFDLEVVMSFYDVYGGLCYCKIVIYEVGNGIVKEVVKYFVDFCWLIIYQIFYSI